MHLHNVPARDDIASAKVFEDDAAAHANFFGIDLHEIAGMLDGPVFRLANGPGRFRSLRRCCRKTAGLGGSCNTPRRLRADKMRPTMETET